MTDAANSTGGTGELSQIERDLQTLWENYRVEPEFAQMKLWAFREFVNERRGDAAQYALDFLAATKDLDGELWVALTPGKVSLMQ